MGQIVNWLANQSPIPSSYLNQMAQDAVRHGVLVLNRSEGVRITALTGWPANTEIVMGYYPFRQDAVLSHVQMRWKATTHTGSNWYYTVNSGSTWIVLSSSVDTVRKFSVVTPGGVSTDNVNYYSLALPTTGSSWFGLKWLVSTATIPNDTYVGFSCQAWFYDADYPPTG